MLKCMISGRGNSRNYDGWFPEQLQLSGRIQGFVKGEAYFSSRSLKQGVWGTQSPGSYRATSFLKSKNDANYETCITHSHIIATMSIKQAHQWYIDYLVGGVVGGAYHKTQDTCRVFHGQVQKLHLIMELVHRLIFIPRFSEVGKIQGLGQP